MVSPRSPTDGDRNEPDAAPDTITEYCPVCGDPTTHYVYIELRTESEGLHAEYSREPYRVMICTVCDHKESERVATA